MLTTDNEVLKAKRSPETGTGTIFADENGASPQRRQRAPLPVVVKRISIFGLGYVGAVSLACLARDGHRVTGVDIDSGKLDLIRSRKSPILEEGIQELAYATYPEDGYTYALVVDAGQDRHLVPHALVESIGLTSVTVSSLRGKELEEVEGEVVVLVSTRTPRCELVPVLESRGGDFRVVGDAVASRDLAAAILEGFEVGAAV